MFRALTRGVDRDDALGAGERCAVDADSPTPPQADHRDRRAGSTLAALNTAPTPVIHATADQRGAVERNVGVDLHHRVLVHEHLLGEGRQIEGLVHMATLPGHSARPRPRHLTSCSRTNSGWPVTHCGQCRRTPRGR